ncbi:MAG TPA: NnrS family protein [Candidatus Dormibacteraeota bacterium]|nr:NnrS family protein [Candidatus Dormibacteraeota bacterium]
MSPEPPAAAPPGSRRFLVTSLLFALTFGTLLGALTLAALTAPVGALVALPIYAARMAHAHAQVFGFAALFIMGVAYHALPRLVATPLAMPPLVGASYWLQSGGVLAIAVGAFVAEPLGPALHIAGAAALVLAAIAFAVVIGGTFAAGKTPAERIETWLLAGCAWLVVASVLALAVACGFTALVPAMWDAALYGFAASWIFGFGLRMLPAFLHLHAATGWRRAVALMYQAAVLGWVGVVALWPTTPLPAARVLAGAALCAAVLVYVVRLGIATSPPRPGERLAGRFFEAAYGWLLVWVVCVPAASAVAAYRGGEVPPALIDFGRHAFTFGFLTQMIIGVALRILPALSGAALWSSAWRDATFWLLNGTVALRGLQVVVAFGGPPLLWPFTAVSGALGVAAFVAFTVNLAMTLSGAGGSASGASVGGPPASGASDRGLPPVGRGFRPAGGAEAPPH